MQELEQEDVEIDLRHYASILWRWSWLIALGTVVAAGASYAVSRSMPRVYAASTTLLVNQAQTPGSVAYNDILTSERLTRTYSELVRKRPVLEGVIQQLKLPYTPQELDKMLSVRVVRDTMLLEITAESTDPKLAADIANTTASVFIGEARKTQMGQADVSREAMREQLRKLEQDIRTTSAQIDQLRSGQDSRSPEARQAELARLQSMLSQYQTTYSQLLKSDQDMQLAEAKAFGSVVVAEAAAVPTNPVRPKLLQNVLLAALVGMMLAAGVALLVEYLDDTVKSNDDVARAIGAPTLGHVVRVRSRDSQTAASVTRVDPRSPVSEAYRVLRSNLQFSLLDRVGRVIVFTSAGPGEGKTTIVVNLAYVMAQAGMRVILVDADLRRPSLHRYLGVRNMQGLTTALLKGGSQDGSGKPAWVQELMVMSGVPNLMVMASGPLPPNPSELLGSMRMVSLLEALKGSSDVVLLDAPPLIVADPGILARLADGVVLVVDATKTRAEALVRAKEALDQVGGSGKLLGVVLNKLTARSSSYHYYYRDHYYAQSGDGREWERPARRAEGKQAGAGKGSS